MNKNYPKVLLISPLPPPAGGIATWTKRYIKWSKHNNLNVEVINTAVTGKRLSKINAHINLIDEINRTKNILIKLRRNMTNDAPELVHINTACGRFGIIRDYLLGLLIKKRNIKLVVHYHCNIADQVGENKTQLFFLKKLSKIADINLILNTSSKEFLNNETDCDGIIVPNFIDESFLIKKDRKINNTIKKILFVGHVQQTKGVFEIIESARKYPNILFTLAGPVSNEIKIFNMPLNIEFLGEVSKSEIINLLSESDIFLFPSYTEGFANALLEAMAMGLPVIATDVGANFDMLENYGGLIVQKRKYQDIIRAIEKLENHNVRKKMSKWNIEKVHNNYFIDGVMEKIIEIYRKEINQ